MVSTWKLAQFTGTDISDIKPLNCPDNFNQLLIGALAMNVVMEVLIPRRLWIRSAPK